MSRVVDAMVEYIGRNPGTSFVELERVAAEHGVMVKGDQAIELFPNAILWAGVSMEFFDLIVELKDRRVLEPRALNEMEALIVYGADGKLLRFPVAKRAPKDLDKGYAQERWIPITYKLKPGVEA